MSGFRTTAILGCLLVAFGCNNNPPSPASGAGNGETGPSASSNEPTEDVWTYAESVDRLTGNASGQATRVHPIDNGTAELVAECVMSADAQVKYARIRISFFHGDSKPIAIDRSVGFRDPVHALLRYTTVAGREQRIPVDSTYQNSIDLNLPDIATERQAVEAMLHVATSPTAQEMPHFAGDFAAGFVRADFARIEIPLEGGVTAVIDLQPQAPDLQRLLASCLGNVYAAARPTEVTVPPADHVTIAPTDNRVDNTSGEGGEQRAPDTAGDLDVQLNWTVTCDTRTLESLFCRVGLFHDVTRRGNKVPSVASHRISTLADIFPRPTTAARTGTARWASRTAPAKL